MHFFAFSILLYVNPWWKQKHLIMCSLVLQSLTPVCVCHWIQNQVFRYRHTYPDSSPTKPNDYITKVSCWSVCSRYGLWPAFAITALYAYNAVIAVSCYTQTCHTLHGLWAIVLMINYHFCVMYTTCFTFPIAHAWRWYQTLSFQFIHGSQPANITLEVVKWSAVVEKALLGELKLIMDILLENI